MKRSRKVEMELRTKWHMGAVWALIKRKTEYGLK